MGIRKVTFMLIAGHSLADYPLQGEFLALGKYHNTSLGKKYWSYCLSSHALIHGGVVLLITNSLSFGIIETVIHAVTDWFKCERKIEIFTDQAIHYTYKIVYLTLIVDGLGLHNHLTSAASPSFYDTIMRHNFDLMKRYCTVK